MKSRYYLILLSIILTACKQDQSGSDSSNPPSPPPMKMIQSQGCTVTQDGNSNNFKVNCSDGSFAELYQGLAGPQGSAGPSGAQGPAGAPGAFHVKDSHGTDHSNYIFIGSDGVYTTVYNQTSGNVLTYINRTGAMLSITGTFYDQAGCTGNAYYTNDVRVTHHMGAVFGSQGASPTSANAFKIMGYSDNAVLVSIYSGGNCSPIGNNYTQPTTTNPCLMVQPVTLDSTDLLSLPGPTQLVGN